MKKLFILVCLFHFSLVIFGQNKKTTHSLAIELIPIGHQYAPGNGLSCSYNLEKGRFYQSFTLGYFSIHYNSSFSSETTINYLEQDRWSTEIDYEVDDEFPFLASFETEELQNLGFHQFKPKPDYRLNRYVSYELLYKILGTKIKVLTGMGLTFGLTNRSYTVYGLDGTIIGSIDNEERGEFWININARAKYLYFGPSGKLILDYQLADNLYAGISGGFHYIFNKKFAPDAALYYLGLRVKVDI